jgi:cytochrome P450
MLKTKFDNFPKGKQFSVLLGDLLGKGIFAVDGECWRFQRKLASLELGSVSIRSYAFDLVNNEIKSRLVPLLASLTAAKSQSQTKSQTLDLQDVFRRFSFDTICKFSFGFDPECLLLTFPVSDFADAFDVASKLSAERALVASPIVWKLKRLFNLGSEKELKKSIKLVNELATRLVEHRRRIGFSDKNDLLSKFMGSIDDDKYLRDTVVSFLLAGRDTVASGLTSFFWLLSQHPEVESAIREESDRVMSDPNQELASFEQLREMQYLNAAVLESMRLFPPVQFDSKFCLEDDILPDGTFVRKGTRVTYHPYAMGRMDRIWGSDCLEFKPERWLKNGKFVAQCPFKYPVFQAGPRVCLGKDLASMEMKTVALAIIRKFNIRISDPGRAPRFAPGLTATVRGGLSVVVEENRAL